MESKNFQYFLQRRGENERSCDMRSRGAEKAS